MFIYQIVNKYGIKLCLCWCHGAAGFKMVNWTCQPEVMVSLLFWLLFFLWALSFKLSKVWLIWLSRIQLGEQSCLQDHESAAAHKSAALSEQTHSCSWWLLCELDCWVLHTRVFKCTKNVTVRVPVKNYTCACEMKWFDRDCFISCATFNTIRCRN